MKTFKTFLIFEIRRSCTWLNLFVLISLLFASVYVVHRGVDEYNDMKEKREKFQEIERKKVDKWHNYEQYGGYGINLYFMPSPLCIFFNNTSLFSEATAHIDVSEKLNIYRSFKGKEVFMQKPGRYVDFSGLALMFGSLLGLFYGYDTLKNKEFLKLLARLYDSRRVYWGMYSARLVLLFLCFLFVFAVSLAWSHARGIEFILGEWRLLGIFVCLMLLVLAFFFTVGMIIGGLTLKHKVVLIILAWLVFMYFFPVAISSIVEWNSDNLPKNNEMELTKLSIVMNYEKEVMIKSKLLETIIKDVIGGKFKSLEMMNDYVEELTDIKTREYVSTQILKGIQIPPLVGEGKNKFLIELVFIKDFKQILDREFIGKNPKDFEIQSQAKLLLRKCTEKMMRDFEKKEFPKIQIEEITLAKEMSGKIDFQQYISCLFPSTFYLSVNNEISSRGYLGILDFYEYVQKVREGFLKFYIPKKVDEILKEGKDVEPFFKDSAAFSNVRIGKSQLPQRLWLGFLSTLLWYFIACRLSYFFYRRSLFPKPQEEVSGQEKLSIELNKHEATVVLTGKKITISNHLYNVFSGVNKGITGKVVVEGVNLASEKREVEFVYLCQQDKIPGEIRVNNFIYFITGSLNVTRTQRKELRTKLNLSLSQVGKKNFGDLEEKERAKVLLETVLLKKSDIYMFHDFAKGLPADFVKEFKERLHQLKDSGVSILYVTNDLFLGRKISDNVAVTPTDAALLTISI